jgi:hypothetical protein
MKNKLQFVFIVVIILTRNSVSFSSTNISVTDEENAPVEDTLPIKRARLVTAISGASVAYLGSMAYLQYIWYKDVKRVPFEFYNDLGGYNQIDKFGHIYGSYVESYIGFHSLLWAGVPRKKAALYGGSLGFILQLPIEIWDGMYEGWGFSWSDVGANALGSLLIIGQELAFQEQRVKYKFTFSPSPYARNANGYLGAGFNQVFYDYNGHTYWLSTGINSLIGNTIIPDWVNIAVGYSAGGMYGEFENKTQFKGVTIPVTERYRQFLFSLDIDFCKIPTRNKCLKKLFNSMFLIKVPFPAIEINTKGNFKFYPLYY